jgi:hypothetical protein
MAGIDWDDLRYVLALGDAGSLAGAARTRRRRAPKPLSA